MSRIILKKRQQQNFLNSINKVGGLEWSVIADMCGVSERTLRDWRREKFYMQYEATKILSKKTSILLSDPKMILPEYWSTKKASHKGAIRRYEIYGNPGTPDGRRKGGINSQKKFLENIEYFNNLGIKIKKIIREPKESPELSEFIGILLGDGGITNYQVVISFNRETDNLHAAYVQKLITRLFRISSTITLPGSVENKTGTIVISSKSLVEFLQRKGLKVGNKILNKVDIPSWITKNKEYRLSCVRGLMDTDGSFYLYKHKVNNKVYSNFAICFTNYSTPLLNSVYDILKKLKLKPSKTKQRVYLYRKNDIEIFLKTIGTSNPKHINKYKRFIAERYGSGHNRAVLKTA